MGDLETVRVRQLLRGVFCTGFRRDIVGAGLVGEIVTKGRAVEITFQPNTRDAGKVAGTERNIRRKGCNPRSVLRGCFSMS